MAFRPLFKASILIKADMSANSWKTRIVSTRMMVFGCFTAQFLNGRNSTSNIYYGLVFKRGLCFRHYEN